MNGSTTAQDTQRARAVDPSVSLDGFIAGANETRESPPAQDGELLHEWTFDLASFRGCFGEGAAS